VPLGGNRKGTRRTYLNLAAVMLLGGLWHGASWNFVVWGGAHGALLAAERAAGPERLWRFVPPPLRTAWTFFLVLLTWVPFRAADFAATGDYFRRLFALAQPAPAAALLPCVAHEPYLVGSFAIAAAVVWLASPAWSWTREIGAGKAAIALALLALAVVALATQKFNPFIYFLF
jgi:alginate O-acetyltransferase complex protein AlgI